MRKKIALVYSMYVVFSTLYAETYNLSHLSRPFILFSNPSLMTEQSEMISAIKLSHDVSGELNEVQTAVIVPFQKNSFSAGYVRSDYPLNRVVAGYSLHQNNLLFGTSFSVFYGPIDPELTVDAALSLKVFGSRYVSLIFRNILGTDSILKICNPEASVAISGLFPSIKNHGFDISYTAGIHDRQCTEIEQEAQFSLYGHFFESVSLHYSAGLYIVSNEQRVFHERFEAGTGVTFKLKKVAMGLFFEGVYGLQTKNSELRGSIQLTPFQRKRCTQDIDIKVTCGESKPGVYVTFLRRDNRESSSIKNWVLVISSSPSKDGKIVKTFSGGNILPSTIYWDYRDIGGKVQDYEKVYVRLVITDGNDNIYYAPWETVYPCSLKQ